MIHFLWKNTVLQSISQAGHLLFPFSHISAFAEIQSHVLEKLHSVLTFLLDCNWGNLHCLLSTAATPTRLRILLPFATLTKYGRFPGSKKTCQQMQRWTNYSICGILPRKLISLMQPSRYFWIWTFEFSR